MSTLCQYQIMSSNNNLIRSLQMIPQKEAKIIIKDQVSTIATELIKGLHFQTQLKKKLKDDEETIKLQDDGIKITKLKLLVYYALLQGDQKKTKDAIDYLVKEASSFLDMIMENESINLHVLNSDEIKYAGNADSEKARQAAKSLQATFDYMFGVYEIYF